MAKKISLKTILQITNVAEQALIAYLGSDEKGLKKYLTAARDAINAVLAILP